MYVLAPNLVIEKYPYSLGNLRKDRPNVSFPKIPTEAQLAKWGVYVVHRTKRPEVDHTKNVNELSPVYQNNAWVQTWEVINATDSEILERTAQQADGVRAARDELLAKTDWRFRSDLNPSQAWIEYCQALRDVPAQAGFPWDVVWPEMSE
jgi:hypothetical protein